jgi:DNA end-binding protein Ku
MAVRANWKGALKIGEVTCPVALYTAASTAERIAFHTLNRQTGHRVHRQYVDAETDEPVEQADQVKGYETSAGEVVVLEPDEIAAAIPDSDKILDVSAFVGLDDIDDLYFDRPYYLAPSTPVADEAFALIRDGMRADRVAAIARTVIFRRMRSLLIRPHDMGLIATTLDFDYEVRSAKDAFEGIKDFKIDPEMLDLANHIIKTKSGKFDPSDYDDRYEAALAELVKAKLEGRKMRPTKPPKETKTNDLLAALRESAGMKSEGGKAAGTKAGKSKDASRGKSKKAPLRKAS